MQQKKAIIVIGGGISGLSAAWELQQQSADNLHLTMLEAQDYWGGKIATRRLAVPEGEIIVDGGPESFVTRKPEVWELAHELGLGDHLVDPGSETSHMFVLDGGKPVAVPLSPLAFVRSPLMSLGGKLRMLAEPFVPARQDNGDESLAAFASRRLGTEAMEKFIGPILAGIYNTDPHTQSILTTSPIMREMEAEYGGLFKAVVGRMLAARRSNGSGPRIPRFFAFRHGAQVLVDQLVDHLQADMRLNAAVTTIEKIGGRYRILLADGEQLQADGVILSAPANSSADLLQGLAPQAAAGLAQIRHTHIGTVSLVYRAADVQLQPRVHGLMVPRREQRQIDAVTFTSLKMPDRAPQDYLVLRVFFGAGAPELIEYGDQQLLQAVQAELVALLGITAEPLEMLAFRWPASFPQADVGHLERVAAIEAQLPARVVVTGSSYRGIGVPDCIRQGRQSAADLLLQLHQAV